MSGTGIPAWLSLVTLLMEFFVLAVPVGLVLVIIGVIQYFRPWPAPLGPEDTLRQRFAAGEINQAAFEEMLRVLRGEKAP